MRTEIIKSKYTITLEWFDLNQKEILCKITFEKLGRYFTAYTIIDNKDLFKYFLELDFKEDVEDKWNKTIRFMTTDTATAYLNEIFYYETDDNGIPMLQAFNETFQLYKNIKEPDFAFFYSIRELFRRCKIQKVSKSSSIECNGKKFNFNITQPKKLKYNKIKLSEDFEVKIDIVPVNDEYFAYKITEDIKTADKTLLLNADYGDFVKQKQLDRILGMKRVPICSGLVMFLKEDVDLVKEENIELILKENRFSIAKNVVDNYEYFKDNLEDYVLLGDIYQCDIGDDKIPPVRDFPVVLSSKRHDLEKCLKILDEKENVTFKTDENGNRILNNENYFDPYFGPLLNEVGLGTRHPFVSFSWLPTAKEWKEYYTKFEKPLVDKNKAISNDELIPKYFKLPKANSNSKKTPDLKNDKDVYVVFGMTEDGENVLSLTTESKDNPFVYVNVYYDDSPSYPETNRFILFREKEADKGGGVRVGFVKAVYNPDGKYSQFKFAMLTEEETEFITNAIPGFKENLS